MEQDYFKFHIDNLKNKYPVFLTLKDYHIFSLLCIKYFFFSDAGIPFDPDIVLEYLTDGPNDGGIDAIFNDPTSEGNDVIIVQSKYYEHSELSAQDVAGELYKINETIKLLQSNKVSGFNEKLVTAFRNATSQCEDNGEIRICFFTSYQPKSKRERNKIEKNMKSYFNKYDLEMNFRTEVESQIELCDNGKLFVDYDKLVLDRKDNYLKYENSIIVNISAQSLQELQNRRRNGLLGMNLRYYVRQKAVDSGIETTISKEPENFWYKNNGILIVCDDYSLDGTEIKLFNFSIVNGGQTTNRIGKLDIDKDFYLQCKIVKAKGNSRNDKDTFINNIAESTNSQKPIKKADLKANTPDQLRLRERLHKKHIYYITKKGDKTPKQYTEPYQTATLEQVGKLGLAAILQMPGSARSNSQRMYNDEYYYSIFGPDAREGVIADLLKISYYYDQFVKTNIKYKGYDEKTVLPMIKNGRTFQYACITLLCKINCGVFSYDMIASLLNNTDELKIALRQMGDINSIIANNIENESETFFEIFSEIGEEVLGYCFDNALEKAESEQKSLAPSDYLKSDLNYYKDVIKRLWSRFNKSKDLRNNINKLCNK
ncbi:AIPR family protein [Clostridium tertium]|uniref:AIPR family protein n=1 Tax=Clostridium tertium TaxID=1559 RepID=UPI0024B34A2C|nr:AIPR family protein [Clostridium tertium]MDI9215610.1 AIPR family protein [Clostridium tertium]